ncbi:hypothetical protein J4573_45115 [Actinomadura barringtoniae]|uniref:DUF3159 domain-containing protein n=1 Tax=Actinomadura barringtoniae TaxID=1427535 RepID=A0A939PQJ8_9ACTN|nr:VC0807 family protein [Actinomadura barringtoniae]MBO2454334.1 hypothetical protein [Actinomadura barringtoniae]
MATIETTRTQTTPSEAPAKAGRLASFMPLILDVAVPLGIYFTAREAFGLGLVPSLILSSVIPGIRTVASAVWKREFNGLAGLILAVNVVGILLSFVSGDPRIIIAKDSGISSVVGIVVLISAFRGKALMTAGLKPWVTKGDAARTAAWDRLLSSSATFRGLERRFSVIWGAALLTECVARVIGAFTLPVDTMAWLSTVMLLAAIAVATFVGGGSTADPMEKMVAAEAKAA